MSRLADALAGSVGLARRAGSGTYRGGRGAEPTAGMERQTLTAGDATESVGARRPGGAYPSGAEPVGCSVLAAADGVCSLDTAVASVRSGGVAAAVVGLRADLALAALVALRGVGAAASRLPRGAARFGPGLPVSSACWMFSRSLLTVLLTLRKFLRASLSVVSRSLRTSRVPLSSSLRRSLSASCRPRRTA